MRIWQRRAHRRWFCIAALGALLSCTSPPEPAAVFRFGMAQPISQLDPRYATDAASTRVQDLLFRGLTDFDALNRPVPDLASWRAVTPTHYRFSFVDRGVRFHDGHELTAQDVAATYRFVLNAGNGSPHRGQLSHIERIEVPDRWTLDFHLSRVDPMFPGRLTIGVLPKEAESQPAAAIDPGSGSGPFQLMASTGPNNWLLRRRADGLLVELLRVADPTVRLLKLLRGELDLIQNDLPPELIDHAASQPGIRIETASGDSYSYLGFNLQDPITGDRRFRQAVAQAIDRRAIIRYLWGNRARLAESPLAPQHWAAHDNLPPYAHDPAAARALLAEAFPGRSRVPVAFQVSTDPLRLRIATLLQQQLTEVGIDARLLSHEWGTFYGDIKAGRFQMFSLAWVGIKMPDIFRYAFHSASLPPAGANRGRLSLPSVDALIERAEAAPLDEAAVPFRQLQELIHHELPYVPLWYEDQVAMMRDQWRGYRPSGDGGFAGLIGVTRVTTSADRN